MANAPLRGGHLSGGASSYLGVTDMQFLRTLLVLASVAVITSGGDIQAQEGRSCVRPQTKIVGGTEARIEDWPGQAVLRLSDGEDSFYFCGGTAIAKRWVLTAAHCLPYLLDAPRASMPTAEGGMANGDLEVVIGVEDLRDAAAEQGLSLFEAGDHASRL